MLVFDVIHCSTSSCTDQPLQYMLTTLPRPQISSFTQHQLPRNAVPMLVTHSLNSTVRNTCVLLREKCCAKFALQLLLEQPMRAITAR